MMHRCASLLVAVLALVLFAAPAVGQASVRAYVTPQGQIGVGGTFALNVEVTGTQDVRRDPLLPDISAFAQYLGSNTQSSTRMAGGRTTVSFTIQYRYQALTEGTYTIPSFSVEAGGQAYATEPVEVAIAATPVAGSGGASGVSSEDLFITAEASSTSVLEGQPFILEYRIWTRVDVTNFGMTRVPEPEGFWVEDVTPEGQPTVEQRARNGVQYATAIIRRVALIPTGAGPREIEPIGVEAQVRVRGSRDPFSDVFGRSSLFGTSSLPVTVLANPLTIDVRPLPGGAPEPYSGIVGALDVDASVDRDSIDANDAVTLTVRVTGSGNVRAIPTPTLDLPDDFEVFPPEVSERVASTGQGLSGSKTFEYVLIPRAPGSREIPAIDFGYYDVGAGGYRTATSEPIPLSVAGTPVEGPAALGRSGVAELRRDIRFIRLGSLDVQPEGAPLFATAGFWIFALLPMVGVLGAVALRRHQELLIGDVAYARGRRASRVAKQRLAEARRLSTESDPRPFYAEVARALRGVVADRLNLSEAGLQTSELTEALSGAGLSADAIDRVRAGLDHCDRQRFAPPTVDTAERERFLEEAAELMGVLDRELRK
ncbi:MAG: BatD family protein [Gemmatimonadota bacterium]